MELRKRHLRTVVADGTCDASEPALAIQWENDNPDLLPHSHLIVAQACKLAEDDPTLANDPAEALRQATETSREIAAEVRPPASNSRLGALIILTALLFLFAFALGLLSSRHLENFIPADPIETQAVSLPSAEFAPPERLRTAGVRIVRKSATETFDQPTVALQVGAYESRAIAEQWAQVLSPRYQHAAWVAPARVHDKTLYRVRVPLQSEAAVKQLAQALYRDYKIKAWVIRSPH